MEIIEQHLEEEKINFNSTVFIRSNIETVQTYKPVNTPLLERIKWPLIGSLSAIAFIILLGIICTCLLKTKSTGSVNLTVTNTATSNNDSPMCNSSLVAPSCPSAFQILENAPAEGLPPPYHAAVDINRLLAIPTASRNASEIKAVIAHRENETTSSSQVQREQHWPPADHGLYNSAGGLNNLLQESAQIIFGRIHYLLADQAPYNCAG